MQWDEVIADLLGQLEQAERAELQGLAEDLTTAELARVAVADRLRGQRGSPVTCDLAGGLRLSGRPTRVLAHWFLLDTGTGQALVLIDAVVTFSDLGRRSGPPLTTVQERLTVGHALRGLVQQRAPVVLFLRSGGRLEGTIRAVGADHVDITVHPSDQYPVDRRQGAGPVTVPVSALAAVLPAR